MNKKILSWVPIVLLIGGGIALYVYANKIEAPAVGDDGKISGNYSLQSIMSLGEPYRCDFKKKDDSSEVLGIIHTDGKSVYGEFRIITELFEKEFNSFLVVNNGDAYAWTSLGNFGYKSNVAGSATSNASPSEQAQIVGLKDKIEYNCTPWTEPDPTIFVPPTWINFQEL